jgi:molecular chaperone DnaK
LQDGKTARDRNTDRGHGLLALRNPSDEDIHIALEPLRVSGYVYWEENAVTGTAIDFGIDRGATNSTIEAIDGAEARVIPNKVGSTTTPSAVWINRRGNLQVGQEDKERALVNDWDNGDVEFKLRMGLGAKGEKVFARSGHRIVPEGLSQVSNPPWPASRAIHPGGSAG